MGKIERYSRNKIFTKEEMNTLRASNVCIIGCGGLGGYILEMLSRVGVGNITVIDGDVFEESNLNRQLLSNSCNIGNAKVEEATKRIKEINPDVNLTPVYEFLSKENVEKLIIGSDIVIDALDDISTRLLLQDECERQTIPLIHGAIAGWYGQITTIFPGDRTLDRLYKNSHSKGIEVEIGNPSFTPALVASIQVSETIKVLLKKDDILKNKVLYIDVLDNEYQILTI